MPVTVRSRSSPRRSSSSSGSVSESLAALPFTIPTRENVPGCFRGGFNCRRTTGMKREQISNHRFVDAGDTSSNCRGRQRRWQSPQTDAFAPLGKWPARRAGRHNPGNPIRGSRCGSATATHATQRPAFGDTEAFFTPPARVRDASPMGERTRHARLRHRRYRGQGRNLQRGRGDNPALLYYEKILTYRLAIVHRRKPDQSPRQRARCRNRAGAWATSTDSTSTSQNRGAVRAVSNASQATRASLIAIQKPVTCLRYVGLDHRSSAAMAKPEPRSRNGNAGPGFPPNNTEPDPIRPIMCAARSRFSTKRRNM